MAYLDPFSMSIVADFDAYLVQLQHVVLMVADKATDDDYLVPLLYVVLMVVDEAIDDAYLVQLQRVDKGGF